MKKDKTGSNFLLVGEWGDDKEIADKWPRFLYGPLKTFFNARILFEAAKKKHPRWMVIEIISDYRRTKRYSDLEAKVLES